MAQATKEHARRERLREYEAELAAAQFPVGVLVMLAKGREARGGSEALEEAFAATPVEGSMTPIDCPRRCGSRCVRATWMPRSTH